MRYVTDGVHGVALQADGRGAVSTQQQQHAASTIFVAGGEPEPRAGLPFAARPGRHFRPGRAAVTRAGAQRIRSTSPRKTAVPATSSGHFSPHAPCVFFFGGRSRRLQAMFPKMAIVAENYGVSTAIVRTAMLRTAAAQPLPSCSLHGYAGHVTCE